MSSFIAYFAASGVEMSGIVDKLRIAMERVVPHSPIKTIQRDHLVLAYDSACCTLRDEQNCGALLLGDALIEDCLDAVEEAQAILDASIQGPDAIKGLLAKARGNFLTFARVNGGREGVVAVDSIATRPAYHGAFEDGVLVASSLTLWRAVSPQGFRVDLEAGLDKLCFGKPLAEKTFFQGVSALQASEILCVKEARENIVRYWNWTNSSEWASEPSVTEVLGIFHDAVRARLLRRNAKYCLLSGGMDSRLILATLVDQKATPIAMTFGMADSQDLVIARQMALAVCVEHRVEQTAFASITALGGVPSLCNKLIGDDPVQQKDARWVWSGDGGSVCFGAVYLHEQVQNSASAGDLRKAAQDMCAINKWSLPKRLLDLSGKMSAAERAMREMCKYDDGSAGKEKFPYIFLLFESQRRHQWEHYETVSSTRIELLSPFFDFVFLKALMGIPSAKLLEHRFYDELFRCLAPEWRSVPWQTYPGHAPCPLPPPAGTEDQWSAATVKKRANRAVERHQAREILTSALVGSFAPFEVKRSTAALLAVSRLAGMRKYQWMLDKLAVMIQIRCLAEPLPAIGA